ncbi:PD-(D/E)XK nuclease family protein [Pseudodesulfovibrio sp.]|uniref:PD-(D/E)XK nuclease family protein n=1 Tax=unclassified Pseudodesulfovibrio TaxID=2661612 RepID=UPI003AFF98BA
MEPILLIPWRQDFLDGLGEYLVTRPDFSDLTVLFPHNRPRRYLKAFFKKHPGLPRPCFLPRMTSIAEFISGLRRELAPAPVTPANHLDLVEMLHGIVTDLRRSGRGLLARLPELDREAFLPWGLRLARLLDDLLRQGVEPTDLTYMEGEVSEYASGLLEQLSAIHHAYVTRLFERGWTTPGLDWRFVTGNIGEVAAHLAGTPLVAAGFYALSGAEDLFFHKLWEDRLLHPIIHSDPALAEGNAAHHACAEHVAWMNRWHTRPVLAQPETTEPIDRAAEPDIRFVEGFDRHSQLAALAEDLGALPSLSDTAVVLPDEGALLPVLHHLPEGDPNISMGYPLARTSLARLVETLLSLQENRLEDGRYHWKDVIALIRHPYLRLLGPEDKPLRRIFHHWEEVIRRGERYLDPLAWEPPYGSRELAEVDPDQAEPLRREVLERCLTGFRKVDSFDALGQALNGLATMLHKHGERLWHTYLMDAECLFRLTTSVIPQLRGAQTSKEPYGRSTLFAGLRRILAGERVSFEPDPLAGLQVLGVLETRLLRFRRVRILDGVEERLPGTDPYDPLLPDPLRNLLGLPDSRQRDNVAAYNFYRLLMGADEAVIYYQSGTQPGLLDAKSVRSRFVEQLLWEREKKEKRIIEPGDPLIRTVTFASGALHADAPAIEITASLRESLRRRLTERGLSPSTLDSYLKCPKQFFYSYLSGIRPLARVEEEGDRSAFGSLVHETLHDFFEERVGLRVGPDMDPLPLLDLFRQRLDEDEEFGSLPLDTRMALAETGRRRLRQYVASQESATLLGLERELSTSLDVEGISIPFSGKLDRIEQRREGIFILDYKTGGATLPRKGLWQNEDLWCRMHEEQDEDGERLLLRDLRKELGSVQLPAYLHLYASCGQDTPSDAALVLLAKDGETKYLFGDGMDDDERKTALSSQIPDLIEFLAGRLLASPRFEPNPGRHCQYCDFKIPCGS